jgi:UDP-N-acetylmuramate dehydrogenase
MEIPELFFPQVLIDGSFVGYRCADREIPPGGFVAVEQLLSIHDAITSPEAPFLRWTTRNSNSALFSLIPPSVTPPGTFTDGLWQYGVSELFIAYPDSSAGYLEFEMTPEGNWVALRFDAPRKRSNGYAILSKEPWMEDLTMVKSEEHFGMEFSYNLLEPFINRKSIAMQCCVSSGRGEYGLFPWWEESTGPADFHQPEHFYRVNLL